MLLTVECVWSGRYDVIVGGQKVSEYVDQGSFGELALMYNMPRAATIIATSDGKLWAMVTSNYSFCPPSILAYLLKQAGSGWNFY